MKTQLMDEQGKRALNEARVDKLESELQATRTLLMEMLAKK